MKKNTKGDKTMRQGALVYDEELARYDIRFGLTDYHGGLHCGTGMDVMLSGKWVHTRIEFDHGWYLVDIPTRVLDGLIVRI